MVSDNMSDHFACQISYRCSCGQDVPYEPQTMHQSAIGGGNVSVLLQAPYGRLYLELHNDLLHREAQCCS